MPKKKSAKGGRQQGPRNSGRIDAMTASPNTSHGGLILETPGSQTPQPMGVSDSVDPVKAEEVSAFSSARCYLLEITAEIRHKIWNYAVKQDTPVSPRQVKIRSNKFWPYPKDVTPYLTSNTKPNAEDKKQLLQDKKQLPETFITAAQLSRTCHQIYDEVAGTGLFYQVNELNFVSFDDMLPYLVAITPVRRNAIRSVTIKWDFDRITMKHALTMLATCEGLRKLEVVVNSCPHHWYYSLDYWNRSGFEECLTSDFRGLETFKLKYSKPKHDSSNTLLQHFRNLDDEYEKHLAQLKIQGRKVEAIVTRERTAPVPRKKIQAAEEASRLNIFGEGRLGPDKKPGIISSRTRGQLQKQKSLNELGLIKEADEHPKFSKFGDLLWDIRAVTDSRELASDHGKQRIEVHVTWAARHDQSWEILDRIVNLANVLQVVRLYVKNPEAYDIAIAISTIKEFVEKDSVQAFALDSLITMMKRNDSAEAGAKAKRLARSRAFR